MRTLQTKSELYELNKPCTNPKPDRRNKDNWMLQPEFPPGLYIVTSREEQFDDDMPTHWIHEIERVGSQGGKYSGRINENGNNEQYTALMDAMYKIEPGERCLRHTLALHEDMEPRHMCEVLAWMLRYGLVNPEVLDIAFKNVLEEWNAEEE
jgi:hypothetical protein